MKRKVCIFYQNFQSITLCFSGYLFQPEPTNTSNLGHIQVDGYIQGSAFSQTEGSLPSMKPKSSRPRKHSSFDGSKALVDFVTPIIIGVGFSVIATTFLKWTGFFDAIM